MILTLESLKTAINALKASFVKPNWNENDSSKEGYIKNRPFYEEVTDEILLPEQNYSFVGTSFDDAFTTTPTFEFTGGSTYTVIWDGEEYSCIAYYAPEPNGMALGNPSLGGVTGGGGNEPFCVVFFNGRILIFPETSGKHTFLIKAGNTTIHKIDEKFLPEQKPATLLVTCNDDMGTFDKPYSEILEAYNNGQIVQAKIGGSASIFTVVAVDSNEIVLATSSVIDNPGSNYYGDHDYSGRHLSIYSDGTYKLVDSALLKKKTNYSALKTTDKTVFGAINEINSKFTDGVDALILSSPNGTRFQITIGNDGVLTETEITEVN